VTGPCADMPRQLPQQVGECLVLPARGIEPDLMIGDEGPGRVGQHPPPPVQPREIPNL
jgi:hypothetical protein